MIKLSDKFILYIGILLWQSTCEVKTKEHLFNNECVNCDLYSGKCKMNTTGWAAFKHSTKDRQIVFKLPEFQDLSDAESHLAPCIHDGYDLSDHLETFICFWAPYMGCQGIARSDILNKHHMHHIVCQVCAKYCGCKLELQSESANTNGLHISLNQILVFLLTLLLSFFNL